MTIFTGIKPNRIKKNKFNLSHEMKFSCNMGQLIPIVHQEVLPGDSFKVNSEIFMRLAPMIAPMMHRVNVFTHYFFVPNRLIWSEWEDFITGGKDGASTAEHPYCVMNQSNRALWTKGRLADYLGVPVTEGTEVIDATLNFSGLPPRAYLEIYNEYYRDQNLTDPVPFDKGGGRITDTDLTELTTVRNRPWEKDYFTSALPWAQRNQESVKIQGDVQYQPSSSIHDQLGNKIEDAGTHNLTYNSSGFLDDDNLGTSGSIQLQNIESLGIDINELRQSNRLQEWLERSARGGSRYVEQLLSFFGVISPDSRIQRPEYLGGGKTPIVISEVLQTGETATTPQGNLAGHGISVGRTNSFTKKFLEHGHVIGIMSVLPKTAYQQGMPRILRKYSRYDYYWKEFAHLGEQEVRNHEIYWDKAAADNWNDETFGYQSRYAEYKYCCSHVAGDFRDNLDYWHMGRKFTARPALNEEFVSSDPTQRIYAVTDPDVHKLYVQLYNNISALRPIPYFGTPYL